MRLLDQLEHTAKTRLFAFKAATVCFSLVWLSATAAPQSIQPIYSFTNGPANNYNSVTFGTLAQGPDSSLVQGPDGNFYGTSYSGGTYNNGTVFQITTNGVLTMLYSFSAMVNDAGLVSGVLTNFDGAHPHAGLTLGPDGNFYGTTYSGGSGGYGTVFEITTNGVLTTLYSFSANADGANPYAGLTLGPDGNFYGTAYSGGTSGNGTVFEITTNGALTTLHSFSPVVSDGNDLSTNADGASPYADLTLGPDGNFYGTTSVGGTGDNGTVFEITTNGVLTPLYSFSATSFNGINGLSNPDGANPHAGLALGPDGKFYGTTYDGGTSGFGTVFQITTNGALTMLYSFSATSFSPPGNETNSDGANPISGLTLGHGKFYGATSSGGTNGYGTVFQMETSGKLTTLVNFNSTDGANPSATLTVGSDGNLYGTSHDGGSSGLGTVFQMTAKGVLTTLVNFADVQGAYPRAELTLGPDGNFYGTTSSGGSYSNGTVFEVMTNGALTALYSFNPTAVGGLLFGSGPPGEALINADGANPYAGLTLGSDGNLYGTTHSGGTNGEGAVFQITTNGVLTTIHSFSFPVRKAPFFNVYTNADGENPYATLVLGPNGNFYGTAYSGGSSDDGTMFQMTTNGVFTTLASFGGTNGDFPAAGLTMGPDGNFYGTTSSGGTNGYGTVFELTTNGTLTTLVNFTYYNGVSPSARLTLGPDGNFYGTTYKGGSGGNGTVFQMTTSGVLTTLYSFSPPAGNGTGPFGIEAHTNADGANPFAGLALGPDGNFYGTTCNGGTNAYGTVFEVTAAGALTTLANFAITNGATPYAGLTLAPDGNFYGTTLSGGSGGDGVIYRLNLSPSIIIQPSNQMAAVGSSPTFTVTLFGTAPFEYQWLANGTPIADATNNALIIPNVTPSSVGDYQVIITNAWGSTTSSIATLSLGISPTITNQPAGESVPIGGTATFSVGATGTPPLAYQWYFNTNASLSGANNAALSFGPVIPNQSGQYQVLVTSPYGSATSSAASLTVLLQPNCYGISNSGSGTMTLLLASTPNSTNRLWATTNLALPLAQWQPISTNSADATGLFQFTDTNTGNTPARFYILSSP